MALISTLKQQLKPKEAQELRDENFPCLIPDSNKARGNKGNRCYECMPCCYWNVITYFNQKTIDALVKCTRLSLDLLKRRMQPPSKYSASSESGIPINADAKSAFFKVWCSPISYVHQQDPLNKYYKRVDIYILVFFSNLLYLVFKRINWKGHWKRSRQ